MNNLFKKDYIVGIDIGSYAVKIVQLSAKEGNLCPVKAELKDIGVSETSESYEKEIVSALRYLVKGVDLKRSTVIVSINCPNTFIKKIIVPYMPKSELREGIMLDKKNYFPSQTDQSIVDFEVTGDVVEKGVRRYEVMVGTCPLNTVNKYLAFTQKAGIKAVSFISASYALQKLAENALSKSDGAQCYVDIGQAHTELIIYKDGLLAFTRKIPLCGNDFTKALTGTIVSSQGKVNLSIDEAEKIKKDIGISAESGSGMIDNRIPATQIFAMLRTPTENLVNEIDRCLDYYREESGGSKIKSITVFGGGASLGGLIKFLSQGLGMDVRLGDALDVLKAGKGTIRDREKISHRLNLAVGAALTEAKGLNLLPPEIKEEKQRTIKRETIEVVVTSVVIILALFFIGLKIKIGNFDKRISVAKLELASLQPQFKMAQARKLSQTVLVNEPYWEDVFKELGSLIPDTMYIDNMRMENETITMKGIVNAPDGQQIIANFIIILEKGLFDNVKLVESKNLPEGTGIEFELKCWLDYEK